MSSCLERVVTVSQTCVPRTVLRAAAFPRGQRRFNRMRPGRRVRAGDDPMMFLAFSLAGIALIAADGRQPPSVGDRSADEAAVRSIVRQYADAREKRDAGAIAEVFTPDADQLVSSGEWRLGREKVVPGTLASSAETGGRRETQVERVRFVSKEVAIADARYSITGSPRGDRHMWSTFVVVKVPAGWRIAAIRNMLPSVPAAPAK